MQFFTECKTKEEAKATFRRLSKCFHPDVNGESQLMIELKKQFDAWNPNNTFSSSSRIENPYQEFSYAYNPRVEVLERELSRLRFELERSRDNSEARSLRYLNSRLQSQLEENGQVISHLNDRIHKLNGDFQVLFNQKAEQEKLMTSTMKELYEIKGNLKEIQSEQQINQEKEIESEKTNLTLWQKVKYVMRDKSIKHYK